MTNSEDDLLAQQRELLRKELRARRRALSDLEVSNLSARVLDQLLQILGNARNVGSYLAFGKEVDLAGLTSVKLEQSVNVHVPIVQQGHHMVFAPITTKTHYSLNQYGIREPLVDSDHFVTADQLDTVLVPLVGFDPKCNRMGMGGGYYDRAFSHRLDNNPDRNTPRLIGVAYECQRVDSVFPAPWDVPLDCIVTESTSYFRDS